MKRLTIHELVRLIAMHLGADALERLHELLTDLGGEIEWHLEDLPRGAERRQMQAELADLARAAQRIEQLQDA